MSNYYKQINKMKQAARGETTPKEIAISDNIRDAIVAADKNALISWKAKDFQVVSGGTIGTATYGKGIEFYVSSNNHHGKVIITINNNDLYDIRVVNVDKRLHTYSVKATVLDCELKDLVKNIDILIR